MDVYFKNHHGFTETPPDALIEDLSGTAKVAGLRWFFVYDGKPYNTVKEVELDGVEMVVLRMAKNSLYPNIAYRFWDGVERPHTSIRKDSIVGYDIVDMYDGGKYEVSCRNIVVKH